MEVLVYATLVIAVSAFFVALAPRKSDSRQRFQRLELELLELRDLFEQQSTTIRKLHGRMSTRAARDQVPNPADPMARLPGETGEQWKARMGRTITGITRRQ